MQSIASAAVSLIFFFALGSVAAVDRAKFSLQQQQAYAALNALENGERAPFAVISPTMIQHNPHMSDGNSGSVAFLKSGLGKTKVDVVRLFQDGDYIWAHTNYSFFGTRMVAFDVWRLEDGLFAEHWDNLQVPPKNKTSNRSGHTMLDGPTVPVDLDKTQFNRALVSSYSNTLITPPWNTSYLADDYVEHNPYMRDGVAALHEDMAMFDHMDAGVKYVRIVKVLAQGDFVLTMSQAEEGSKRRPIAVYDLYRVSNGRIVEHWDTIQAIPPANEWKNQNGKF